MIRKGLQAPAATIGALCLCVAAAWGQEHGQSASYARMAPLTKYLISDRRAEIALARTAAPPAISIHATILVLTSHGYQIANKGANGFTCLVERAWMSPFDDAEFWNWKKRSPVCYNAAASRSILMYTFKRTDMVVGGLTKSVILNRIAAAVSNGQLSTPEPGSMAYMMSRDQYLADAAGSWMPHLMFYAPKADGEGDGASWGADQPGSPVVLDSAHRVNPEPWTLFFVPVSHWSNDSPAPLMH